MDVHDRPIVYICAPYSGNTADNVRKTCVFCQTAVSRGYLPVAPHLYFPQFIDNHFGNEREVSISLGLRLMESCDELWVCGMTISEGMRRDIEKAKKIGMRIRCFDDAMMENANRKV